MDHQIRRGKIITILSAIVAFLSLMTAIVTFVYARGVECGKETMSYKNYDEEIKNIKNDIISMNNNLLIKLDDIDKKTQNISESVATIRGELNIIREGISKNNKTLNEIIY